MNQGSIVGKDEALRRFSDHADVLAAADSPYGIWNELWLLFEDAYSEPKNMDFIARVYDYADWCVNQPRGTTTADDLLTCACVWFYEEIPRFMPSREDIPNWFTRNEFLDAREIFRYYFTQEEYQKIEDELLKRKFRGE